MHNKAQLENELRGHGCRVQFRRSNNPDVAAMTLLRDAPGGFWSMKSEMSWRFIDNAVSVAANVLIQEFGEAIAAKERNAR